MNNKEDKIPSFFKFIAILIVLIGLMFISFDVISMINGTSKIGSVTGNTFFGINLILQSLLIWRGKIPQKINNTFSD